MPFYYRKSVSAGPFRFNLSSSGVGVSVGVKGLRFGTGPRGHYVHAGRGGIFYRSSLGRAGQGGAAPAQSPRSSGVPLPIRSAEPNVEMIAVSSASVLEMKDERYGELLEELNTKQNAVSSVILLAGFAALAAFIAAATAGIAGAVVGIVLVTASVFVGNRLDTARRSAVVLYDLEPEVAEAYEALTRAFDHLAASSMKWHVDAGGAVRDLHTWKRNAGASTIVDKRATEFDYSLPRVLKTNVTPPTMRVGKETLYWLPDVVLVVESTRIGAVAYDMLDIRWEDTRFIEAATVPSDAQVVGQTWKHPNKNGGPDRRFANNRQLPICLYESIHLRSHNGLNELLQVSTSGRTQQLATAVRWLAMLVGARGSAASLPSL